MITKTLLSLAVAASLTGCFLDSDNDDETSSTGTETTETTAETETEIETTPEVVTNNVVAITDSATDDTGELRYIFDSGLTQGRVALSVVYAEGETESFQIGLYDSNNSTGSVIADLKMDTGKFSLRDNNGEDFDFTSESNFTEGESVDVVLTWNTSVATEAGTYTVSIDDVSYGPIKSENITPGVEVTSLGIRLADNSKTAETAVFVDDLAIYSDEAGTAEVFSDDFESYAAGTSLTDDSPYSDKTFSTSIVELPSDE
ncbi:hypothetical protein [Leucothrix arctica]|uniref:Uncharacterized protein n=1 Tax=Leucothrix arctica TaxID=1481894 RepID=A0A317C9Q6_9GAMM|nr:hypothetical protein [Leucothrix arctica]PWQ93110.1 hypothetical protein DKT75_20695 [Leucothrix arctica]